MATTEPIRSKENIRKLGRYFLDHGQFRDYALLVLGIHTALRISDLLKLRWADVYDENRKEFYSHISLTEHKTGKEKTIALNPCAIKALRIYFPYRKSEYIFVSRNDGNHPITRQQAWRVIRDACTAVGLSGKISCHSLRKTFGYHAWKSGEVSPVVLMQIYNHCDYEVTKRYLGVAQDDLDKAYLEIDLF